MENYKVNQPKYSRISPHQHSQKGCASRGTTPRISQSQLIKEPKSEFQWRDCDSSQDPGEKAHMKI